MADKNFKVKNKLVINGLAGAAGPLIADASNIVDSTPYIATQYGGTGTTTSPSAGQVLYSSSGTTYTPTTLSSLVQGAKYQADAPTSPATGDIWIESDSNSDSFDPNIIRRKTFTATAGQTAFVTDVNFVDGYEQVYFNGLLLLRTTDYTTSGNNTITLVSAAALNDIVEVVTVTNLNSTNTYTQAEIDAALAAKLSTSTAASTYLTQSNASSTYLTQSNASSTYAAKSNPTFTTIGGNEGGQINLGAAATNTTLSGDISLDIYQNRFRIFESGGSNRGAYLNIASLSNGVASELVTSPSQSGNNGKYLTTDGTTTSWAAPTASDNFTLLNTGGTALTGATTITVSGISGKNSLYLFAYGVSCVGSVGRSYVGIRLNTDTGNNYWWAGFYAQPNSSVGYTVGGGNNYYPMGYLDRASDNNYFAIEIKGTNSTGIKPYQSVSGIQNYNLGGEHSMVGRGHYTGSSAITSVSFYTPDGQNFDSGTLLVYGA